MPHSPPLRLITLIAIFLGATAARAAIDWRPVDPSELTATPSEIASDAGAEILYNFEEVDAASGKKTVIRYYQRVKIFNDKGARGFAKIDIPSFEDARLHEVAARVITPDGAIVLVDGKDFHTRDVARQGKQKIEVTSFSFPQLTPGAIAEWQCEIVTKGVLHNHWADYQSDYPTRLYRAHYRPPTSIGHGRVDVYYGTNWLRDLVPNEENFYVIEKTDVPPFKTEPFMPPPKYVRQPILFKLLAPRDADPIDKKIHELTKATEKFIQTKGSKSPLARQSAALVDGAATDEEKISRIHDFCRASIRNTSRGNSGFTSAQLAKIKPATSAGEVLARGYGNRYEITALLIALARAANIKMHIALCRDYRDPDIYQFYSAPSMPDTIIGVHSTKPAPLSDEALAEKVEKYKAGFLKLQKRAPTESAVKRYIEKTKNRTVEKFYDPASAFLPATKLHWYNSWVFAYWYDPDSWYQKQQQQPKRRNYSDGDAIYPNANSTPVYIMSSSENLKKHIAKLRLDADGTLEGDIIMESKGQFEYTAKNRYDGQTPEARAEHLRTQILERLPNAEITNIIVNNADSPLEPLAITYRIRIPNYADATGGRIFFQPALFQKNAPVFFTSNERQHEIEFPYPWSEHDEISITLPSGYTFEETDKSQPLTEQSYCVYMTNLSVNETDHTLAYTRSVEFKIYDHKQSEYEKIKKAFDEIRIQDDRTISLKKITDAPAPASQ